MKNLTIDELHSLRVVIFDNAESLQKEAKLLLANGMHGRAYLLAHFCFEELGKIPIVVGIIGQLAKGEKVNWKKARKRFNSHEEKIESQNGHYYVFGLETDLIRDSDLKWLVEANRTVRDSYQKKNLATYVDVQNGRTLIPKNEITKEDAEKMVMFAFECLRAHWHSEILTNPILYKRNDAQQRAPGGRPRSGRP